MFQRLKLTEELEKELQETRATQDKEQRLRVVSLHSASFSSASFTLSGQSVYILLLSPLPPSPSVVSLHSASFSSASFTLSGRSTFCVFLLCLFHPHKQLKVISLHSASFSSASFTLSTLSHSVSTLQICIIIIIKNNSKWSAYILPLSLLPLSPSRAGKAV